MTILLKQDKIKIAKMKPLHNKTSRLIITSISIKSLYFFQINIISNSQYGFKLNHSSEHAILHLRNTILNDLYSNKKNFWNFY